MQDERKLSLSINLKDENSSFKLNMASPLNFKEKLEGGAADIPCDDATTSHTLSTLPAELRFKIYAMSWEPRRVTLARSWLFGQEDLDENEFYARTRDQNVYDFFKEADVTTVSTSTAPLPVTLWINKESRNETLRYYEKAFACPRNGISHVYFNFRIDELVVRRHGDLRRIINSEDLARVKALIVPMGFKEARSASTMLDKLSNMSAPIVDLDGKIHQLHNLGMSVSVGLEPYDPENPSEDVELRRFAGRLQREITNCFDLPPNLSATCPSLERVRIEPTVTCGFWPTESSTTLVDEDGWFLSGNCKCHPCALHWAHNQLSVLFAHIPAEQAWSVGDACPPELGKDREMQLGNVTVTWRARVDVTAGEPEDDTGTRRAVADWALAAKAVADKLGDNPDAEPLYTV